MKLRHIALAVGAAFALGAVVSGCSAKADMEKICNAERLSGAASEPDPAQKAMKIAQYLSENVHSRDAKNILGALASVSPADKPKLLKQAALEVGYDGPCPIADLK